MFFSLSLYFLPFPNLNLHLNVELISYIHDKNHRINYLYDSTDVIVSMIESTYRGSLINSD